MNTFSSSFQEGQGIGGDDRVPREEINKIFKLFDLDGKGSITVKDVHRVARELGERLTLEEVRQSLGCRRIS